MAQNILPKDVAGTKTTKQNLIPVGRTLPRDIVKWIQGLDLSYSVRDPKKDLSNGFLIAEIFSRYYPGRVSMHSFDNSHNTQRRQNNWTLLELFFKKNEVPFSSEQYGKILADNDWDQLFNFVSQVYMFLTQRKVQNPPLATFVNSKEYMASGITDGGTQSFLLKDKGLERLDNLKDNDKQADADLKDQISEKQAQLSVSSKRTNFMRVPSKPISQNIDNLHYQIDVKNIQIRPVQGNIMKVREQQLAQANEHDNSHQFPSQKFNGGTQPMQDSFQKSIQDTQGEKREAGATAKDKQLEKTIYEVLNETLMIRMQQPHFVDEMKKFKVKNNTLVQAFIDSIDIFSDEFSGGFFQEIIQQKEAFINFIFKDTNDLWKFFNFTFQCLNNLPVERDAFKICIDLVHQFGQKSLQKDPNKTRYIFTEFFLPQMCQLLKDCIHFEKKEMITQLVYSFCPPEPFYRHQVIAALKEHIPSIDIFMQALTVLIRFEVTYTELQKQLFEDYIHYAQIHLFSQSPALSSCAISIFSHIAEIAPAVVHGRLYGKVEQIAKNKWWQNRCLAIILFSALARGVIESQQYQALIKAPQSGQKFFSMENDRLISDLKGQVAHFANGILLASQPASSDMIRSTTLIYIVDLLGDSKVLLNLFTRILLDVDSELRYWVLYGEEEEEPNDQFMFVVASDKSFKYKTNIKSKVIQQFAPSLLLHLVDKLKQQKPEALSVGQFQLLDYCYKFTDFKIMNMESCEVVTNSTKDYIYLGLCDKDVCAEAAGLIKKLLDLQYKAEVNITDQEQLFSRGLMLTLQTESKECFDNLLVFLTSCIDDANQSGNENLKAYQISTNPSFLKRVHQEMLEMQPSPLQNPQLSRLFERVAQPVDESHFSQSAFPSGLHQAPTQNNLPSQIDEDMEISAVDRPQEEEEYMEEAGMEDENFDEQE